MYVVYLLNFFLPFRSETKGVSIEIFFGKINPIFLGLNVQRITDNNFLIHIYIEELGKKIPVSKNSTLRQKVESTISKNHGVKDSKAVNEGTKIRFTPLLTRERKREEGENLFSRETPVKSSKYIYIYIYTHHSLATCRTKETIYCIASMERERDEGTKLKQDERKRG